LKSRKAQCTNRRSSSSTSRLWASIPDGRNAVWDHGRALRQQTGAAIVMTTHYMDEAEGMCDRVAVMHQARFAAVGTPKELCALVGPL
jgi:ABC-2 type transport system ATP-binding protein